MSKKYLSYVIEIKKSLEKFTDLEKLSFDLDGNKAFNSSVLLAKETGVNETKIHRTEADFADMPLLIEKQVAIMASICAIFEINIEKDGLKALATAAIGAGGAVAAGTAVAITLAIGKAFIEVCKANKMGRLCDDEILSSKGIDLMKTTFPNSIRK